MRASEISVLIDVINDLEFHPLQGETEAEDDVVRARDPDGAVGLEDAAPSGRYRDGY